MNNNVQQTEHGLLREMLRRFLLAEVQSSCDAGRCGRVVCGAVAALDSLLAAHPLDRRGRCRSCQRPGWLGRRRRVCMVYVEARYWLWQPTHRVRDHLASELGVDLAPVPEAADPEATEVLPGVEPGLSDPPTDPLQTPAVPPIPRFQAGRPDQDHGGAGVNFADSVAAAGLAAGGIAYPGRGWPVTRHRDQVWLSLRRDVLALAIPILLSTEVTQILIARRCIPPVLAHPYTPEHHIMLTGERYGVPLPWPDQVHQVTGGLLLPPTVTPRGPITWIQPPREDSLRLCREIDLFGALRTVLNDLNNHR